MSADQISNPHKAQSDENETVQPEAPVLVIHGTAHLSATSQTEVGE